MSLKPTIPLFWKLMTYRQMLLWLSVNLLPGRVLCSAEHQALWRFVFRPFVTESPREKEGKKGLLASQNGSLRTSDWLSKKEEEEKR